MTTKELKLVRAWAIAVTRAYYRQKPLLLNPHFTRFACGPLGKKVLADSESISASLGGREHANRNP